MEINIDPLTVERNGNKRTIRWTLDREDFLDEIPYDSFVEILPCDIFDKEYKVLQIYGVDGKPYDGFMCCGFVEIELI